MQMYNFNVKILSCTGWHKCRKSGVFFLGGGAMFFAETVAKNINYFLFA
jgi:hypothetical protein